jgi:multidrug efflux pump subunit AcrB
MKEADSAATAVIMARPPSSLAPRQTWACPLGAIDDLDEIRNTPIAGQGRTVKLSDVADVHRG